MINAKIEIHQPDGLTPDVTAHSEAHELDEHGRDNESAWGYSSGAAVEPDDGSRTIEVQTIFRGVVIGTRHLSDPGGTSAHRSGTILLLAGIGVAAVALGLFIATAWDVGREKAAFDRWQGEGKEARTFPWKTRSRIADVAVFGGFALGLTLSALGLRRRGKTNPNFIIGPVAGADAPVASEFIPSPAWSHPLVAVAATATGPDYVINVTPGMDGDVSDGKRRVPLAHVLRERGPRFSLPQHGRVRLQCDQTTFLIAATTQPRALPVPLLTWRWDEHVYSVGSAVAMAFFLIMILGVPPDPRSLTLDMFNTDSRFIPFLIKAPETPEQLPDFLNKAPATPGGASGERHRDQEGKAGKETSKNKDGLMAIKGPKDNQDPHLAKEKAQDDARNAGILGVFKQAQGSHIASIWGDDTALGADAANVIGGLVGNQISEAYGVSGLGVVGTGRGGGGTGDRLVGLAGHGTIGKWGGGGDGPGYGPGSGVGQLASRRARAPEVIQGIGHVRGSLDKEIIRRIIRRHINEVKYCYEQELPRNPNLGGRLLVQFTIAPTGQVISSVLQNSTMGNVRVESCTVQAVRRWEFPKPDGGGIVMVSYPFVLTPAGGGQ